MEISQINVHFVNWNCSVMRNVRFCCFAKQQISDMDFVSCMMSSQTAANPLNGSVILIQVSSNQKLKSAEMKSKENLKRTHLIAMKPRGAVTHMSKISLSLSFSENHIHRTVYLSDGITHDAAAARSLPDVQCDAKRSFVCSHSGIYSKIELWLSQWIIFVSAQTVWMCASQKWFWCQYLM